MPMPSARSWRMMLEQVLRFARGQRRGRLVHDDDARVRARAPWRSRPSASGRRSGVETGVVGGSSQADARRAALGLGVQAPSAAAGRAARPPRARCRGRCWPRCRGSARASAPGGSARCRGACASRTPSSVTGLPSMQDLALVRRVRAAEDLHQRALAGAVLAHQREHLAGAERQRDVSRARPRRGSAW